jgi:hypothetical protein
MSAKLYQYHEEKAKRLALRTNTDPDAVWLRSYVKSRIYKYLRDREDKADYDKWEREGQARLWRSLQAQFHQQRND